MNRENRQGSKTFCHLVASTVGINRKEGHSGAGLVGGGLLAESGLRLDLDEMSSMTPVSQFKKFVVTLL